MVIKNNNTESSIFPITVISSINVHLSFAETNKKLVYWLIDWGFLVSSFFGHKWLHAFLHDLFFFRFVKIE